MNLHTPERLPDETQEQYKKRLAVSRNVAKQMKRGWKPTVFHQHQPNKDKKD